VNRGDHGIELFIVCFETDNVPRLVARFTVAHRLVRIVDFAAANVSEARRPCDDAVMTHLPDVPEAGPKWPNPRGYAFFIVSARLNLHNADLFRHAMGM
jgi:hypothetical protein